MNLYLYTSHTHECCVQNFFSQRTDFTERYSGRDVALLLKRSDNPLWIRLFAFHSALALNFFNFLVFQIALQRVQATIAYQCQWQIVVSGRQMQG